VKAFF